MSDEKPEPNLVQGEVSVDVQLHRYPGAPEPRVTGKVAVTCSRDGHAKTLVTQFERSEVWDAPSPGQGVQPVRRVSWRPRAIVGRDRVGMAVEREQMQGRMLQQKLRAYCRRCKLDVQRERKPFEETLDRLADGGVTSIELSRLAAILG